MSTGGKLAVNLLILYGSGISFIGAAYAIHKHLSTDSKPGIVDLISTGLKGAVDGIMFSLSCVKSLIYVD